MSKRTIEVDDATATALESRAAEVGLSVAELLAEMVAAAGAASALPGVGLADLDRRWATIKAGEPTVADSDVVHWLDTWGTPRFRRWKANEA